MAVGTHGREPSQDPNPWLPALGTVRDESPEPLRREELVASGRNALWPLTQAGICWKKVSPAPPHGWTPQPGAWLPPPEKRWVTAAPLTDYMAKGHCHHCQTQGHRTLSPRSCRTWCQTRHLPLTSHVPWKLSFHSQPDSITRGPEAGLPGCSWLYQRSAGAGRAAQPVFPGTQYGWEKACAV